MAVTSVAMRDWERSLPSHRVSTLRDSCLFVRMSLLNGLRAAMLASELVITGEGLPAPGSVHARRGRPSSRSVSMRMDYAATRSLDRVRSVRLLTSGLARVPSTGAPFRGATWQRFSRLGLWVR